MTHESLQFAPKVDEKIIVVRYTTPQASRTAIYQVTQIMVETIMNGGRKSGYNVM